MVKLQNLLRKDNSSNSNNPLPLLNSFFSQTGTGFGPFGEGNNFKSFMKQARASPHLMGFLNVLITDIISDDIKFVPINRTESGRNKVLKAEAFWRANNGLEVVEETGYDFLIDGIGFNWLGKVKESEAKEFIKEALKQVSPEIKEGELEFKASEMVVDLKNNNRDKFAKKLRHVAASTMQIESNDTEITGYIQIVGTRRKEYSVDEIMTFKAIPFDGKVYPLAPMESLFSEVYLLWLITQNYVSFFENGGKPDNVFILPKEIAGSKNHQYLIDTLKKYKKIQNKHGNLVFTGDLSVEKLMNVEEQMENKDLGLYLVSTLAMFYGVPIGRIPFLVGKAASGGDSGGLADSGYWRKISVWQSKIEETYNRELWEPFFGVKMKFSRGYKQDEVRETQTMKQKVDIAEQKIRLGLWTPDKAGEFLGIDPEDVKLAQEEKKVREEEELKSGMLNQNLNNNGDVIRERDAKNKAKTKQSTQNKNQSNAGGKNITP